MGGKPQWLGGLCRPPCCWNQGPNLGGQIAGPANEASWGAGWPRFMSMGSQHAQEEEEPPPCASSGNSSWGAANKGGPSEGQENLAALSSPSWGHRTNQGSQYKRRGNTSHKYTWGKGSEITTSAHSVSVTKSTGTMFIPAMCCNRVSVCTGP